MTTMGMKTGLVLMVAGALLVPLGRADAATVETYKGCSDLGGACIKDGEADWDWFYHDPRDDEATCLCRHTPPSGSVGGKPRQRTSAPGGRPGAPEPAAGPAGTGAPPSAGTR